MSVKPFVTVAVLAAFIDLSVTSALAQITIPTVPVGDVGNIADPTTGYGAVAYAYNIGTHEVTNMQYAAFLNAVGATDTNDLYNPSMAEAFGGITRSGAPGSYTYSTVGGRERHPVNFVSFWDAARFANWLHNGQPTGTQNNDTTENGAYTLTPEGIDANSITRNGGWRWAITSEDEWYKAAYYHRESQGGDVDNYWLYPTASNTISIAQANYLDVIGDTVPVGSYPPNHYGTFDQGGNVLEWNEAITSSANRGRRGGSYTAIASSLRADNRSSTFAINELRASGFRVSHVRGSMCRADFNDDGTVNSGDFFDFLVAFFAGGPAADVNDDGVTNSQDFFDFLAVFFSGC